MDVEKQDSGLNNLNDFPMEGVSSVDSKSPSTLQPPVQPPDTPDVDNALKPHYKLRYSLGGHTLSISSLKFSPNGSILASSGMLARTIAAAVLINEKVPTSL